MPGSAEPILRFDRRLPQGLRDLIGPKGPFCDLVALANADPLLDLGMRADPSQPGRGRVTLYLGTTKVLDLRFQFGERPSDVRVSLSPQVGVSFEGTPDPPFDEAWGKKQ